MVLRGQHTRKVDVVVLDIARPFDVNIIEMYTEPLVQRAATVGVFWQDVGRGIGSQRELGPEIQGHFTVKLQALCEILPPRVADDIARPCYNARWARSLAQAL